MLCLGTRKPPRFRGVSCVGSCLQRCCWGPALVTALAFCRDFSRVRAECRQPPFGLWSCRNRTTPLLRSECHASQWLQRIVDGTVGWPSGHGRVMAGTVAPSQFRKADPRL